MMEHEYALQFQSTLPRRERQTGESIAETMAKFQSTLPRRERRERPDMDYVTVHMNSFNPRSREGSDRLVCTLGGDRIVSIHAPAKGATRVLLVK